MVGKKENVERHRFQNQRLRKNAVFLKEHRERLVSELIRASAWSKALVVRMESFNKALDQLNDFTKTITAFVRQTNLLAPNAAIEAARASITPTMVPTVACGVASLARASLCVSIAVIDCRTDESSMYESLRNVPLHLPSLGVSLFREQSQVVRIGQYRI